MIFSNHSSLISVEQVELVEEVRNSNLILVVLVVEDLILEILEVVQEEVIKDSILVTLVEGNNKEDLILGDNKGEAKDNRSQKVYFKVQKLLKLI